MNAGAVFYYLEEPAIPAANKMITPMDEFLAKHYRVLCRSKLIKTQVILFENITPLEEMAVDWEELPDCTIEK